MKCCCTTAHRTAWQRPPNAAAIGGNTIAYHAQVSAYGGVVFCHRGHLLRCKTASVSASCRVANPRKTAHNIHRCNKSRIAQRCTTRRFSSDAVIIMPYVQFFSFCQCFMKQDAAVE